MEMKTIKEVKAIVDSRLSGTDYVRLITMYNDKRKRFRRFKMFVRRVDKAECTKTDLTNVEMILAGETNFERYYDGFYTTYCIPGTSSFKKDHGNLMCFVWYVALD
jgi:hypothetical protein